MYPILSVACTNSVILSYRLNWELRTRSMALRGRIFPKRRFKCYNGASFDAVHRTLLA